MLRNLLPPGFRGRGEAALSGLPGKGPRSQQKQPLGAAAAAAAQTPVRQRLAGASGAGRGGFSRKLNRMNCIRSSSSPPNLRKSHPRPDPALCFFYPLGLTARNTGTSAQNFGEDGSLVWRSDLPENPRAERCGAGPRTPASLPQTRPSRPLMSTVRAVMYSSSPGT